MSRFPESANRVYKIRNLCLFCILLIMLFSHAKTVNSEPRKPISSPLKHDYPKFLYDSKQYYRSISEILRIKFEYGEKKIDPELEVIYLKSAYELREHGRIQKTAPDLLKDPGLDENPEALRSIGGILTASYIDTGQYKNAKQTWAFCCSLSNEDLFLLPEEIPGRIDPARARILSSVIPGSGLLLSGEYRKAAVSFLLNVATVYGIHHFGSRKQFGVASLLFFFEIGWYTGGRNAASEAATDHNHKLVSEYYQSTIYPELDI
jgi:hypothetical protein